VDSLVCAADVTGGAASTPAASVAAAPTCPRNARRLEPFGLSTLAGSSDGASSGTPLLLLRIGNSFIVRAAGPGPTWESFGREGTSMKGTKQHVSRDVRDGVTRSCSHNKGCRQELRLPLAAEKVFSFSTRDESRCALRRPAPALPAPLARRAIPPTRFPRPPGLRLSWRALTNAREAQYKK
jgi:hypothetical protein